MSKILSINSLAIIAFWANLMNFHCLELLVLICLFYEYEL